MAKGITYKSLTGNHDVTRVIQRAQDVLIEGSYYKTAAPPRPKETPKKGVCSPESLANDALEIIRKMDTYGSAW
ncbi:hypothetical protein MLB55_001371 [Salmonella enterica]|uniref:Uncharacterized protein n=2 Tax=Salmonella enterica I TaxID=59201 RepID=A0A5X8Y1M3_SALNE|nr:hypothetical protein [Salmonella enterica]EAW1163192.1 hypothetical protein [Salmonella enterica subsp. enterica]EBR7993963.1 hypothetical protein [Salmonella enterica subsp. enterica serovar Panama]EBV0461873.1 hypothetical protein [Salmonella enterica subsp. enterica serovar Newport]ECJ2472875.1 hypothetical protein [Salmonella enterica subsp. diarizonae]WGI49811.1 hypothetical protein QBX66_25660 [Salmonella enterica subsp. diarizonae serovar 48:i:z]